MKIGYDNGVTVSIDCIAVEKRIPRNMYECSEPDCRICNDPPEYVKLHIAIILSNASGRKH